MGKHTKDKKKDKHHIYIYIYIYIKNNDFGYMRYTSNTKI